MEKDQDRILNDVTSGEYKYGFYTDIEAESIPKGLNEEVIRTISAKKIEPEWLLDFRLKSYRHWQTLEMPGWANLKIPK
jgi:Fe-S cluster assembly protein SufB